MPLARDDYRAVKQMDRKQMEAYLQRVYKHGYEDGKNALTRKKKDSETPDPANADKEQ